MNSSLPANDISGCRGINFYLAGVSLAVIVDVGELPTMKGVKINFQLKFLSHRYTHRLACNEVNPISHLSVA